MLFILFFLLIYFALNSGFSFLLTVLFNHLTTFFFFEATLLRVIKAKNKIFVFYHRKVSFIKYLRYRNIQIKCGEPFHKKVACLHVLKNTLKAFDDFKNKQKRV